MSSNVTSAIRDVTLASNILAAHRILDAFGHVSARHPEHPDRFLISRSLAPALITEDDIIEVGLDGKAFDNEDVRLFVETSIHSEIYRRRSDVQSVVHSHAPEVIPFSVVADVRVKPICHMCGFLQDISAPYDIAAHAGNATDLLIRNSDLGASLAQHLGSNSIVLMRGHGFTAVGENVPEATFRAIYTAKNCQLQTTALQLGSPTFLSDAEAIACDEMTRSVIERAWQLWLFEMENS